MKSDKTLTCVGAIASVLALLVVSPLMNGWALSKIWNWFMPVIFNLPKLLLFQAIGVTMVFNLFTGKKTSSGKAEGDSVGEVIGIALATAVLVPVLEVAMAWIVLQFAF